MTTHFHLHKRSKQPSWTRQRISKAAKLDILSGTHNTSIFKTSKAFSSSPILVWFWCLELTCLAIFGVWLVASYRISKLCLSVPPVREREKSPDTSNKTQRQPRIGTRRTDLGVSGIDVWFALSIVPAVDAMAMVFTFNGQLIRQFHYAVSQRLLFVASVVSWLSTLQHPVRWFIPGCVACKIFGVLLDRFESPIASKRHSACWGTLSAYSQKLRYSESTWAKAALNSAAITSFGLVLSMLLRPPLTFLVPIAHIFFEVSLGEY